MDSICSSVNWYVVLLPDSRSIRRLSALVIITTAHTKVDYAMVAACGVPVFDCKNVCKNIADRENIEVL